MQLKYAGYIDRQNLEIKRLEGLEEQKIPEGFAFASVDGLSNEAKEKLSLMQPISLGQASRISGVSPADISVLMVFLQKKRSEKTVSVS